MCDAEEWLTRLTARTPNYQDFPAEAKQYDTDIATLRALLARCEALTTARKMELETHEELQQQLAEVQKAHEHCFEEFENISGHCSLARERAETAEEQLVTQACTLQELVVEMEGILNRGEHAHGLTVLQWAKRLAALRQQLAEAHITSRRSEHKACPCLHTTPCSPQCTCVQPLSSAGCRRCCSYGSKEQQKKKAEYLVARMETLVAAAEWAIAFLDGVEWNDDTSARDAEDVKHALEEAL